MSFWSRPGNLTSPASASGAPSGAGPAWPPLARQRLTAVAAAAFLLGFSYVAADVILPLWATHDLGLTAADWARVRSVRFAGVLVGVTLLGALSDRFGQRRGAIGALLISGVSTALFWLNSRVVLWVLMPVFGALASTVMVNLNTLTQMVTTTRQGVANTVYRSVGAAAGVAAPIAATSLAVVWGGYPAVFLLLGGLLVLAGWVLFAYPCDEPVAPLQHPWREARQMWAGYAGVLREKPLMRFIHLSQLWYNSLACVGAFAAIRLTRELGMGDRAFGVLGTAGGILTLALVAGAGWFLDRASLRSLHLAGGVIASAGALLMGLSDSVLLTCIGALVAMPVTALLIAPSSMWVSRAAGHSTPVAAFAVHKVVTALYLSVAMVLFGSLESWLGMRTVLLLGGIAGLLLAFGFLFLSEPPRPVPGGNESHPHD